MNLIRVDDRLIHGQVAVGWCGYIRPRFMIIADDEIAADKNDSELYLTGVPFGCVGRAIAVKDAGSFFTSCNAEPYILVLRSLEAAVRLLKGGFSYKKLNIGGIHYTEGRKQINNYIFLNETDIQLLKELEVLVPEIFVQDLPTNARYGLEYVFNKWKEQ
ncbi:MAG TPA: PTS sugar transporter subunit IIB [Clostridiales bacterium]|mgnify:CR=1 FL=1|nr:PTS sugar transporter subunit IIB [Clostridiales bacterium]HQP71014.1 PTS sugar transporter subunit IIB [Clostridiales bacterium]